MMSLIWSSTEIDNKLSGVTMQNEWVDCENLLVDWREFMLFQFFSFFLLLLIFVLALSIDDDSGEKSVSVLLNGEESEIVFIDHSTAEMSVSNFLCFDWLFELFHQKQFSLFRSLTHHLWVFCLLSSICSRKIA